MSITSQGPTKYATARQARADEDELLRRAFAAYFRAGGSDQPSTAASGVETDSGKLYVVLRNAGGILAVYRIRAFDGVLKRLRRWPQEIEED